MARRRSACGSGTSDHSKVARAMRHTERETDETFRASHGQSAPDAPFARLRPATTRRGEATPKLDSEGEEQPLDELNQKQKCHWREVEAAHRRNHAPERGEQRLG